MREPFRHHADDRHRDAIQANRPADDGRIASQVLLPHACRHDGDARSVRRIRGGVVHPAVQRRYAEDIEVTRRRLQRCQPDRL